ncbi:MAG: ACT domain-containing protein [Anaerolineaceae bacterium]
MPHNLTLQVIPEKYAVCKLAPGAPIPAEVSQEPYFSCMRTPEELSLVLRETLVQPDWQVEPGWRIIKVLGPLDFSLVGVLLQLAEPLYQARISIFVTSTYDTDYLMVKGSVLGPAVAALRASGIEVFWGE